MAGGAGDPGGRARPDHARARRAPGQRGLPVAGAGESTRRPIVADRLAQFETEITGLRGLYRKVVEDNEAGTACPADASIVKLYYSELLQRLTDFGAQIGGLAAQTHLAKPLSSGWESGSWVLDFIGSWEWTIPGGSSEIQRTIIAERGLGLPREPSVA
jgi:alkylation response protein AidB-like acyl-CoA dehydrogenase